jgi:DNA-binding GntR family transcriptional regulator
MPTLGSPKVTKARKVFLDLRDKILAGEFEPGTYLTLRPLADHYGTGINAVSEAIKALAAEGVVQLEGKSGAKIIPRDAKQIRSEFIMRIALESEAARRCATQADEASLNALDQIACRVDDFSTQGNLAQARRFDRAFHLHLAALSGSDQLHDALAPLLDRLIVADITENEHPDFPGQKHRELVKELRTRDPNAASRILRVHCEYSMDVILSSLVRTA